MLMPFNKTSLLIIVDVAVLSMIIFAVISWRPILIHILRIVLFASLIYIIKLGYVGFESGLKYTSELQANFNPHPQGFESVEDIDLFVYIGESTSRLNMSLYGYPLLTTPQLDNFMRIDEGFLKFNNVRSTHTHTSSSLLRAFAVTSPQFDGSLTQWGIGDVLRQSGLSPKLFSAQPKNGSFSTLSRFVFGGMNVNSFIDKSYSNKDIINKVKDHQLLETSLQNSGVIFFHSYAGHGGYLESIDMMLSTTIAQPSIKFEGMYGSLFSKFLNSDLSIHTSDYDRAITYIDRNVSHAIKNIKNRKKPAALVYFSDHGEAVYAKRGHESSNFIDEMTTIPMILYFNDSYRKKYPETFTKYRQSSLVDRTRLLDQVSPTILDILQIKTKNQLDVPTLSSVNKHPRFYILEREVENSSSRIDLKFDSEFGFSKDIFLGGTPEPTYISIINEHFAHENEICYHRANSYAKALRGSKIAHCVEFDLVVNDNELNIHHPPASATGFNIEHIFSIAQAQKNSLWIDAKNIDDPSACNTLVTFLEKNYRRVGQVFVEFPSTAVNRLDDLELCGHRLKAIGARTSYYLPTKWITLCTENSIKNSDACKNLEHSIELIKRSKFFTDLSFDFSGYSSIKHIKGANNFKWNTWSIKAKNFHSFPRKDFSFVIMDTGNDPNYY